MTRSVLRHRAVATSVTTLLILLVCASVRTDGLPLIVWVAWAAVTAWALTEAVRAERLRQRRR